MALFAFDTFVGVVAPNARRFLDRLHTLAMVIELRCTARSLRLGLDGQRHPCCAGYAERADGRDARASRPPARLPSLAGDPALAVKPRRLRSRVHAAAGGCAPPDPCGLADT